MDHLASRPGRFGVPARLARRASILLGCMTLLGSPASAAGVDALTFPASGLSPFQPDCNGTKQSGKLFSNAEVEPFVAVNPRDPLNLVGAWQQDRWSSGGAQGLGTGYSFDGGVTWHRIFLPFTRCAGGNAANGGDFERMSDPWVSFSPNGVVHQVSLTVNLDAAPGEPFSGVLASRSTDGGKTWSPAVTLESDTTDILNDKTTITADPTDSNYVYAAWTRFDTIAGVAPSALARSVDNGEHWEATRIAYDPGPTAETTGSRIEVLPDGTLVDLFTLIDFAAETTTLQVVRSTDKGETWSAPVFIADLFALGASDPDTGVPIRDGGELAQMAVSPDGRISVVWQDSRFSDGMRPGIALSESTDGGSTWSAPVQINHDPQVPAFTPSIHVRQDGTVGVSYYDFRHNTPDPATLPTDLWLTRSGDRTTWRENRVTATFDLDRAPASPGPFLGDYQGLVSIGPVFVPFFAKTNDGKANRDDVYAHVGLLRHQAGAAVASPEVERQVAQDEADMTVTTVRATERSAPESTPALRAAAWLAIERIMRARIPGWDGGRVARRAAP
jgi:hypothetical protein